MSPYLIVNRRRHFPGPFGAARRGAGLDTAAPARAHAALEDRFAHTHAVLDCEIEDHLLTLAELERSQNESQVLRTRLWREGRHQDTVVTEPLPEVPAFFDALWERAATLEGVLITADQDIALGLDDHQEARNWAAKTWNALRALSSYTQHASEGFRGGFYTFCRQQPFGARIYPVTQIAMAETEVTMANWGDERFFLAPMGSTPPERRRCRPT